jgi:hypothetical protein
MQIILASLTKASAILKDSVREALDIKILYATVALALLITGLVLTMNFRPVPVDEFFEAKLSFLNFLLRSSPEGKITLSTLDFKRLDAGTEPWTGDYQFLFNVDTEAGTPANLRKEFGVEKMPMTIHGLCEWADHVDVVRVKPAVGEEPGKEKEAVNVATSAQYKVTTKGARYKTRQEWYHQPGFLFGAWYLPLKTYRLNQIANFIAVTVVGGTGSGFIMLLSAVITAFFIPNMLSKGTVDLLLTKPIHRFTLFTYKFLGGLTFMIVNTVVIMTGIWLGLGIQAGVWCHTFLLCILIYTFQFAIFYAVSVLVGVLTRTPILSILAVMLFWATLTGVGWFHWWFVEQPRLPAATLVEKMQQEDKKDLGWFEIGVDFWHAILPRYKDIDWLTDKSISAELIKPPDLSQPGMASYYESRLKELDRQYGSYTWASSLGVSTLFIVIVVGLAGWRFTARDY